MISAEEIKGLMAKDKNGLLPCPFCWQADRIEVSDPKDNPAHESWVHCFHCGSNSGMAMTQEDAVSLWNVRTYTQAILTLQTLLNQAGEALKAIAYRPLGGDTETYFCGVNMQNEAKKALAAIKPYLVKEGKDD